MRIAAATLRPYRLPLETAWASAAGRFAERRGWLLRLDTDGGRSGYGDCAPLPAAGTEDLAAAGRQLDLWRRALPGRDVEACLALIARHRSPTPAARCALETALLDLAAQAAGRTLAQYLDPQATNSVAVNAALGALDAGTAARAEAALVAGFSVLKIKLGLAAPEAELAALAVLAADLPPHARLRLDANRAWDEATAARSLATLAELPVEGLEEPLIHPEAKALRRLQASVPFPLALDESLISLIELDVDALLAAPPVRRLVLKSMAQGGPLAALKLARRAQRAGLECVVTTTVDSACGALAAAHLAAAIGKHPAHGLATTAWLAADTGPSPRVAEGKLTLPTTPGLGFAPYPALLFRTAGS